MIFVSPKARRISGDQQRVINPTELVAALVNHKDSIVEGLTYVQEIVKGDRRAFC